MKSADSRGTRPFVYRPRGTCAEQVQEGQQFTGAFDKFTDDKTKNTKMNAIVAYNRVYRRPE